MKCDWPLDCRVAIWYTLLPNLDGMCGRGGIGRRAALRSLWEKSRGSSSLLDRTNFDRRNYACTDHNSGRIVRYCNIQMNTHLKIFICTGVPFGAVFGLLAGILDGPEEGLITALISGVLFGSGMAVVLGKLQKEATQKSGMPAGTGPRQSATIQLDVTEQEGLERCSDALAILRVRSIKVDRDGGKVEGTFRASWKSFGEKIIITVSENDASGIDVTVSSAPLLKTALLDYGKGKQNVDNIIKALRDA